MKKLKLGAIGLSGLTPLIDTLFILLFALLALSDVRDSTATQEVRIQLPAVEPGSSAQAEFGPRIAILIDADSRVRLTDTGEELADRESLDRALAAAIESGVPEEVVIEIQADRDARHGVAVELLQHLRLRGFANVQLLALGVEDGDGRFGAGEESR